MSTESLIVGEGTKENWAGRDGNLLGYNIDSTTNTFVPREFIVNRNTGKWVLGKDGYLYRVPANQPALEYYSGGAARGILVEPGSTNLATYSEDFRNTAEASGETRPWTRTDMTISSDAEQSPIESVDADTLTNGTGGSSELIRDTTISSNTVTLSLFIKPITSARYIYFADIRGGFANSAIAWFDLQTETVGTESDFGTTTLVSASIVQKVNGYYRISITTTDSTFNTTSSIRLRIVDGDNITTRVNNAVIAIWGAQVEESPIATSYIPTTNQIKSRIADDISLTGASSLIGQKDTGGTLLVEVDWQDSGSTYLIDINDNTASNRIIIFNVANQLRMFARANGVDLTNQGESSTAYTGIQKIAFAYKTDDFELYRNGSSISSLTNGSLASLATLTDIDLGQSYNAGAQANMWIRDARLYKQRLLDSELAALTEIYAPIDGNEFIWNGLLYKVIVKNGLAWLDRNLGATRVATSSTDAEAYGDLYQWGRLADGHQLRNSGTRSTLSSTDTPGHGDFITINSSPYDWRNPQSDNLWQGVNGINNPAPPGWRLPTEAEWQAEVDTWSSQNSAGAFSSLLKLPVAGGRGRDDGSLSNVGSRGLYWSSTVDGTGAGGLNFSSSDVNVSSYLRASGFSVRCVRDVT